MGGRAHLTVWGVLAMVVATREGLRRMNDWLRR
jgi:hypothetical protein